MTKKLLKVLFIFTLIFTPALCLVCFSLISNVVIASFLTGLLNAILIVYIVPKVKTKYYSDGIFMVMTDLEEDGKVTCGVDLNVGVKDILSQKQIVLDVLEERLEFTQK